MHLLRVLLEAKRAGKDVVLRDDILSQAWEGKSVAPTSLTVAVHDLNECLGQDAHIKNDHGIGYQFVAADLMLPSGAGILSRIPLNQSYDVRSLSISPDGRTLAYISYPGSGKLDELYLLSVHPSEPAPVRIADNPFNPFFSADSTFLAYFTHTHLMKMTAKFPFTDSIPQAVCPASDGTGGNWGNDGNIIFCERGKGLYRVSQNGGEPELIAGPDLSKGEASYLYPQVLPGGRAALLTIEETSGERNVAVLPLDRNAQKTSPNVVLRGASNAQYVKTGHILFLKDRKLTVVPFDVKRMRITGNPLLLQYTVSKLDDWDECCYSVSENGTLVYVPKGSGSPLFRLVWLDRQGRVRFLPIPPIRCSDPNSSRDGKNLALTISDGDRQNVFIFDRKWRVPSRIVSEGGISKQAPLWSLDGRRIYFMVGGRKLCCKTLSKTGAETAVRVFNTTAFPVSLSPDGRTLALMAVGASGRWEIWLLDLRVSGNVPRVAQPSVLRATRHNEMHPQFSPDGQWIAYSSDESGQTQIYVESFPANGDRWQLSPDGGREPRWSLNGKEIFYFCGNQLMAVRVQTKPKFKHGPPKFLFEGDFAFPSAVLNYAVFGANPRFLLIRKDVDSMLPQIHMIINWFSELF